MRHLFTALLIFTILTLPLQSHAIGDCDSNGTVTISEVQSAINMFLGLKQSDHCVDEDSSGIVSIAEVQKTINTFLGLIPAASTYSISGTVTANGTALAGVTVSTTGGSAITDASGNYTISGLANRNYTITPSKLGYNFSPANLSVTVNGANANGENFTATAPAESVSVSINAPLSVAPGSITSLSALVVGSSNTSVTWTISEPGGGSIGVDGLLHASSTPGTIHVKATSVASPLQTAEATIIIYDLRRAIHIGGNWGSTCQNKAVVPTEFLDWLESINVNWVGISVALKANDYSDPNIRLDSNGECISTIPSFTDEQLTALISAYRSRGFHVYVTLAIEDYDSQHKMWRWALGQAGNPNIVGVDISKWYWAPTHPQHEAYVAEFFNTYTQAAVHVGTVIQSAGAELFSLGTETDRLFRTRSSPKLPYDYRSQLTNMVSAVRAVFHGKLTYDQSWDVLTTPDYSGADAVKLFSDLSLDQIGISAYFPLLSQQPQSVPTVAQIRTSWEGIFSSLSTVAQKNPGLPIYFTEFGYTDSTQSPVSPNADAFQPYTLIDANGNGVDDGEETQANIYQALFDTIDAHRGLVNGAFLWGHEAATNSQWQWYSFHNKRRGMGIRGLRAESVTANKYLGWK